MRAVASPGPREGGQGGGGGWSWPSMRTMAQPTPHAARGGLPPEVTGEAPSRCGRHQGPSTVWRQLMVVSASASSRATFNNRKFVLPIFKRITMQSIVREVQTTVGAELQDGGEE